MNLPKAAFVDSGRDLSKSECSERRNKSKAFDQALKTARRGSKWGYVQQHLYREMHGWFVDVHAAVWIGRVRTSVLMTARPMGIDPLFWEMTAAGELIEQPLSFRCTGSWTCPSPCLVWAFLDEGDSTPHELADRAFQWTVNCEDIVRKLSIDDFFQAVTREIELSDFEYPREYATLVTGLILDGRLGEAKSLVKELSAKGEDGGFSVDSRGFVDFASEWLDGL